MKVSAKKVAENRAALIATAKRLLQERGFEGAGVADISRAAGLTQGALYGQFKSKNALALEAARKALEDSAGRWQNLHDAAADPLSAYIDAYLGEAQATEPSGGCCLLAACVSDVPRQDPSISAAFADGYRNFVTLIENVLPDDLPAEIAHRRALTIVAALVGGVAMARAVEKADPDLARDILAAAKEELRGFAGEDGPG